MDGSETMPQLGGSGEEPQEALCDATVCRWRERDGLGGADLAVFKGELDPREGRKQRAGSQCSPGLLRGAGQRETGQHLVPPPCC